MSSENLHAPRERLSQQTLNLHFAIVSLMEELDAIDWYRQRADDTEAETLKGLLLPNMGEEVGPASLILQEEKAATAEGAGRSGSDNSRGGAQPGFTVGSLRDA